MLLPENLVQVSEGLVPQLLHFFNLFLFPCRDSARLSDSLTPVYQVFHRADFNPVRDHIVVEAPLGQLVASGQFVFDPELPLTHFCLLAFVVKFDGARPLIVVGVVQGSLFVFQKFKFNLVFFLLPE